MLLRVLHLYMCFRFLLVYAAGFPSSLVLPHLSVAGFSVYLLTSNTESYDEDVEEVGVDDVEEFVDKLVTTNGT